MNLQPGHRKESQKGYSLLETLTVTALAGIMALVSVPNSMEILANYRLHVAAQKLAVGIQFARAKAVAENFNFSITGVPGSSSVPDSFQVAGSEDDQGDILNPWEDRNKNGVKDSVTYRSEALPEAIRLILLPATVTPAVPVSGSPVQTTTQIAFNPVGVPLFSASAVAIYLQNERNARMAVTVDRSGRVQIWRLESGTWTSQ